MTPKIPRIDGNEVMNIPRGSPMWHNIKLNFHFKVVKPS